MGADASGSINNFWGIVVDFELIERIVREISSSGERDITIEVQLSDGVVVRHGEISFLKSEPNERGRSIVSIAIRASEPRGFSTTEFVNFVSGRYSAPVGLTVTGDPIAVRERLSRFRSILSEHLPYYHLLTRYSNLTTYMIANVPLVAWLVSVFLVSPSTEPEQSANWSEVAVFSAVAIGLLVVWYIVVEVVFARLFPQVIFAFGRRKNALHRLTRVQQILATSIVLPPLFLVVRSLFGF